MGTCAWASTGAMISRMRLLHRVVEEPRTCVYLPGELASLDVRLMVDVTPDELDEMLARGWRRFGPAYFRPTCTPCGECVTLRIIVDRFTPSKSQRRAVKAASRLRREVRKPRVDEARLALYHRWHASREGARGWEESPMDVERYAVDFAFPHPCAREVAYYDDDNGGKLVALGLIDETPSALSAAYFFYEPDFKGSLGVANIAHLVEQARQSRYPHVYLGYRVLGCESLQYKGHYHPHELLVGRPAMTEAPTWRLAAGD